MVRAGVCLSGCGVFDGSEIHEAVLTLLALDQAGAEVICCAPNIVQARVVDHRTQSPADETRNVLTESARIARGNIRDLAEVSAEELDALILPGGFGAALNLSTFATQGADCVVNPEVERLVGHMLEAQKPIGAMCIAPATLARAVANHQRRPEVTIGNDAGTAGAIEAMNARHVDCPVDDIVIDKKNRLVTTPAYMLGPGPAQVFKGIKKLVDEVLKMATS